MSAYGTSRRHAPPRNWETPGLRYYVTMRPPRGRRPKGAPTGLEVVHSAWHTLSEAQAAAREALRSLEFHRGWHADVEVAYVNGRHLRWIYNVS